MSGEQPADGLPGGWARPRNDDTWHYYPADSDLALCYGNFCVCPDRDPNRPDDAPGNCPECQKERQEAES